MNNPKGPVRLASLVFVLGLSTLFNLGRSARDGVEDVQTSVTPWSGYYWPLMSRNECGGIRGNLYEGDGPLARYDQAFLQSGANSAQDWEYSHHRLEGGNYYTKEAVIPGYYAECWTVSWFGHCHSWAASSIIEPQPTATSSSNAVSFDVGDKKGLLAESWSDANATWIFSTEAGDSLPPQDAWDFHSSLIHYLKTLDQPIILDINNDRNLDEIWNFPVYRYRLQWSDDGGSRHFQTLLYSPSDTVNPDYVDDFSNHIPFECRYTAYDSNNDGLYDDRDSWVWDSDSPYFVEFAWFATSPIPNNPNLTSERVRSIIAEGVPADCSTAIVCPRTVGGSWTSACVSTRRPGAYARWYTFSWTAGRTATIDLTSSQANAYLYLLTPDGEVEAADDDGGGGTNARIQRSLSQAGPYTIEVTTSVPGQTGGFTLALTGCPIPCGTPSLVSPANGATNAAEPVTFRWNAASGAGSYELEYKAGASGLPVTRAGLTGTTQTEAEVGNAGETITWKVRANCGSATGSWSPEWTLTLAGGGASCATAIVCPQTVSGSWTNACVSARRLGSNARWYTFVGTAGQAVTIDLMSSAVDPFLYLVAPDGTVEAADDDGGEGTNSRIRRSLSQTGTYTIEATMYGLSQTGDFTLALGDRCTAPIGCPTTLDGSWTSDCVSEKRTGSSGRRYMFVGTAGQAVTIDLSSNAVDPYLYLVAPDDRVEASDDDSGDHWNARITRTLRQTGTYTIEATTYYPDLPGDFTLALTGCGMTCGTPTPLIPDDGAANIAEPVTFRWSAVSGATSYELQYRSGVSGTPVTRAGLTGTKRTEPDVGNAGDTIFWSVRAVCGSATGSWSTEQSYRLAGGGSCTVPVDCPATVNGSWTSGCVSERRRESYTIRYTFVGTAGQAVTIDLSSNAVDPYLYLAAPDGTVEASDDDSGDHWNARITRTLRQTGTYTIEATTYYAGLSGDFTLTLTGCGTRGGIPMPRSPNDGAMSDEPLDKSGTSGTRTEPDVGTAGTAISRKTRADRLPFS